VDGLASGLAVLAALVMIFWVILGGPSRARERASDRRRRGGRRPRSDRFWALPSRDREYAPGLLLIVLCSWQLADIAARGASFTPLLILSGVLAIAFSARPDLVGAAMGLIGAVSQTLDRLGADPCLIYSPAQQAAYFLGSGLFILALLGFRLMLTPIRSGTRFLSGATSLWTSAGRPRPLGPVASFALSAAGALDLIDLATTPGVVLIDQSRLVLFVLITLGAGSLMAVFLTVLPIFTLSVLGLGVLTATVAIDLQLGTACVSWSMRLTVAGGLLIVNRIASRFI
jgi:hypothetical protein